MNATRVTAIALLAALGATACTQAGTAGSTPPPAPAATATPVGTGTLEPTTLEPTTLESAVAPMPSTTGWGATVPPETSAPQPAADGTTDIPAPGGQHTGQPDDEPTPEPTTPDPEPPTPPEPAEVPASAPTEPEPVPDPEPDPLDEVPDPAVGPDPGPSPLPGRIRLDVDVDDPIVLVADLVAVPVAPCGLVAPIPASAQAVDTSVVDVDDDGTADAVTTYHLALGDGAGWRVRLDLAGGPTTDVAIEGVGPGVVELHGAVQADFDVSDPATHVRELLLTVGVNASGPNLGVFGIDDDGCLFRFDGDDGNALVVPIHGGIGTMSGLMCDHIDGTGFLSLLEAEQAEDSSYDATYTQLVRVGEQLVPGIVQQFAIDAATQAGWLAQHGSVSCAGIDW